MTKNTNMTWRTAAIVILTAALAAPLAHAAPTDTTKYLLESWLSAYKRESKDRLAAEQAQRDGDVAKAAAAEADAKQAAEDAGAALVALRKQQAADQKALADLGTQVASQQKDAAAEDQAYHEAYSQNEVQQKEWDSKSALSKLFSRKPAEIKKSEKIAQQAKTLKDQLAATNSAINSLTAATASRAGELETNTKLASAKIDEAKNAAAARQAAEANAKIPAALIHQHDLDAAEGILNQQRQTNFDAKFLLTDLQVLKARNEMTASQVDALQTKIEGQLTGTLLGHYIDERICSLQGKCAAGKAADLNTQVNGVPSTNAESISGNSEKGNVGSPAAAMSGAKTTSPADRGL